MPNRGIYCLLLLLAALLFAGCASAPPEPDASQLEGSLSSEEIEAKIKQLVDRARNSESPERENYLLAAAELLVEQHENTRARNLLASLDSDSLGTANFVTHSQLLAELALEDGSYLLAESILTNARLEQQWQTLAPEQEISLRRLRAQLFERQGEIPASVSERITLGALLNDEQAEAKNREAIWQNLMTLSFAQLEELSERASSRTLEGWYSLAALSKNNQTNLERQLRRVEAWQRDWPQHPASQHPPKDLQLLRQLIEQQPRQVALLLPLQGNLAQAGEAVRDGILAAYYQALPEQSQVPYIRQYDSAGETDILSLYQQAVAEGAEFVIGPLDKDKVRTLAQLEELPVPILTLNYTETPYGSAANLETPEGFYQFGLAAEDEARQVARQAYLDGHRFALLMAPDRDWSLRSAQAFTQEWQAQGGEVVSSNYFVDNGSYSEMIQRALLIDDSQARRQELQRLFGAQLEFEPRRRKDLDMIFLIANPEQGRQIKPTLAFHYASDVPVYATSHIYSGVQDSKTNRDLNGIVFNTMPWLFDESDSEKRVIDEHVRSSAIYSRLHALGVDAFHLFPRLPQLEQVTRARLYGATGALQLMPGGRIEREQIWAQFQQGTARPIAPALATGTRD